MLDLLAEFANAGIVFYRRGDAYFYPTRLSTTLNTGGLNSLQEQDRDGFIIVETNYRLYAYTSTSCYGDDLNMAVAGRRLFFVIYSISIAPGHPCPVRRHQGQFQWNDRGQNDPR